MKESIIKLANYGNNDIMTTNRYNGNNKKTCGNKKGQPLNKYAKYAAKSASYAKSIAFYKKYG